ncbi:hypothetical protein FFWV33_19115 [Flavobacterium faecale]|uniref:Uncharacterized protein n=1 Tax=Flavobacterium faecale TaxID=1355330 RepID=A0A2S1LI86_9FLAO|nr:hypothetical protein FFWV33_19115 [Flavobacterium faecale]
MKEEKRNTLKTLVFYAFVFVCILFVNISGKFKSGPCTPNLDVLSIFLIGPVSFILMLVNGIKYFHMERETKFSFYLHFICLLIWILFLRFN